MKDDGLILSSWEAAKRAGEPAILATVVSVSGSAYRRPGARMLITPSGSRTGSISGGCLESDVLKKAWWLTETGRPALRVYDNTSDEEAAWELGLGCNGVVHVLLERWEAGSNPLVAECLQRCRASGCALAIATVLNTEAIGRRCTVESGSVVHDEIGDAEVAAVTMRVFGEQRSRCEVIGGREVFVEYLQPAVPLLIAGADHDVIPVVRLAKELGWHVTVTDSRSQNARCERFPLADEVRVCNLEAPLDDLRVDEQTVAVVMGHSYPQDRAMVGALQSRLVRYLGVLGPRDRTARMLSDLGLVANGELHSPVGLDIGADTPEEIALAIVAEIQSVLAGRPGSMLRDRGGPIHAPRMMLTKR